MTPLRRARQLSAPIRIGLAIGRDRVTAVARAGRTTRAATAALPGPPEGEAAAGVLSAAFTELRDRLEVELGRALAGAHVDSALMPSLVDVRLIALPPLRPGEAKAVLLRTASRHFLGAGERVIGVRPRSAPRRRFGRPAAPAPAGPSLAAAAPAPLVEAVYRAARAAGWQPTDVVPAHAAWLEAAVAATARVEGEAYALVALDGGVAHVLRVERGEPATLRRVPARAAEIAEAAGEPAPLLVLGPAVERDATARTLAAQGWVMIADAALAADAQEAAAAHAGDAGIELVPVPILLERQRTARATAIRIGAIAAGLLVAAAGLELWGAKRELAAVRAQRAAIAATVAPLLVARDSLDRLNSRAAAIDHIAATAPSYTRALLDLALLLPRDAHLTRLHANGDTVTIQAVGARAAAAIESLRGSPNLAEIRLRGPIERELQAGATATERFTVVARLVEPAAATEAQREARGAGALPAAAAAAAARPASGGSR